MDAFQCFQAVHLPLTEVEIQQHRADRFLFQHLQSRRTGLAVTASIAFVFEDGSNGQAEFLVIINDENGLGHGIPKLDGARPGRSWTGWSPRRSENGSAAGLGSVQRLIWRNKVRLRFP